MFNILFFFLLISCTLKGQVTKEKRQIQAVRIQENLNIDGKLNELIWNKGITATDFIQTSPNPGDPALQKTDVKILYDDNALYIGVICYDDDPQNIFRDLSQRDNAQNTDMFHIALNPFEDNTDGFKFTVTAAGVQMDAKMFDQEESYDWNAVWKSAVKITDIGWVIECEIPYSVLRFPNTKIQKWRVNFGRSVRATFVNSWWSHVDPEISGFFNQAGDLIGIKDVKSPMRLFVYPYTLAIVEHQLNKNENNSTTTRFTGGMDIKYGINDAFTLDMTLIPDFSQVGFDKQVLNLSPFEIRFDENRQFFTEGFELFNKGGLFYSRRIGSSPLYNVGIDSTEVFISNPSETNLLNATKISGRTKNNTGLGFFNAIVGKSEAIISNIYTNEERKEQTNPLTNYNIFVLDQTLKHNSFVSFINTNVLRIGEDYDANVTGTEFELINSGNTYSLSGSGSISQLYFSDSTNLGFKYNLSLAKISGNFNTTFRYNVESDTYNPNDLGFLLNNNERTVEVGLQYNIYEPFWKFNRLGATLDIGYTRLYKPSVFNNFYISPEIWSVWNNFFVTGLWMVFEPLPTNDYFEPRVKGRHYVFPSNYGFTPWISSDYRKRFSFDASFDYRVFNELNRRNLGFSFSSKFRVSDRLLIRHRLSKEVRQNDVGFIDKSNNNQDILLGIRDIQTIENNLQTTYIFSNRMGLTFNLRHYWAKADYNDHRLLNKKGELDLVLEELDEIFVVWENNVSLYNQNYNAFTVDVNYKWQFAPGSEMNLTWKNSIFTNNEKIELDYLQNLNETLLFSQTNSISLRILYFIDYLSLR